MPSSGAGGPCDHCGRSQSCCWRRGPPSKPILCNACGSRYLVKRSLEGYKPLQVRQNAAGVIPSRKPDPQQLEAKPKRSVLKRLDSELDSDSAYSAGDSEYMTDDSAEQRSSQGLIAAAGGERRRAKVMRITTAAQLKGLAGQDLQSLAVSLLQSSLRTKPRKPLKPTITALF